MSENQMFRNLAGIPSGRGERLRDNSELYKIPEGGNFKTWLSERESVLACSILLIFFLFLLLFFLCAHVFQKKPLVNNIYL